MKNLLVVVTIFLLYMSIFTIQESQKGIVLRFSKVVRDEKNNPIIYNPGLHFKIPFIETIKRLDSRIQTLNVHTDRYLSKENKDLIVDSYLKWKINDFSQYYVATDGGNKYQAETLLKRKFSDRLRSEFGRLSVKNIITDSRGKLTIDVKKSLNEGVFLSDKSKKELNENNFLNRSSFFNKKNIKNKKIKTNSGSISEIGIKIIDVRIKRIELPNEVSEAIYQRMRAEREAVARQHRSKGQEKSVKIRAIADKIVTETLAEAERIALKLRGEGDAIATKLFADAFNKDPDFYIFIRSLKAYEKSFNKNIGNIMVLSPNMNFFRYMNMMYKKSKN